MQPEQKNRPGIIDLRAAAQEALDRERLRRDENTRRYEAEMKARAENGFCTKVNELLIDLGLEDSEIPEPVRTDDGLQISVGGLSFSSKYSREASSPIAVLLDCKQRCGRVVPVRLYTATAVSLGHLLAHEYLCETCQAQELRPTPDLPEPIPAPSFADRLLALLDERIREIVGEERGAL